MRHKALIIARAKIRILSILEKEWDLAILIQNRQDDDLTGAHLSAPGSAQLRLYPFGSHRRRRQYQPKVIVGLKALLDLPRKGISHFDLPFVKPNVDADALKIFGQLFNKSLVRTAVAEK